MSQANVNRKLSEEELFFYEDQICADADTLFRFCVALTLNQDSGLKLMRSALSKAAQEIRSLHNLSGNELRAALFAYAYEEHGNAGKSEAGDSPLFRFLKQLNPEMRVVTVGRDVCGLSLEQIARIVGSDADKVLKQSATAREILRKHMNQGKPQ